MKFNPEIRHAVESVRVIDTHEHLQEESVRLARSLDFATLFDQYASHDLQAAGMPEATWERIAKPETPLDEKWRLFEPHYLATRNTAYLRASRLAIRDLYGIDELNAKTYGTLTERMRERNRPGVLRWILRDKCGIDVSQVNAIDTTFFREQSDGELFQQDLGVAALLGWPPPIGELERHTGVTIDSFARYAEAIDALYARFAPRAVAVKQQSAYWRDQRFEDVPDADAERVFTAALRCADGVSEGDRRALQDWAFHRCVRLCIEHELPMKIHTGYKAGANYMDVEHIKPGRLTNVLAQYPKARFDLFHIGYPYEEELVALAKHYTNVYVDFCWAWIIDLYATRRFLKQCLTAVPASKLLGFGGDYIVAEPVYGHLRMARDGVAGVLTELVDEGYMGVAEAVPIAHRLLRDNAMTLFRVEDKRATTAPAKSAPTTAPASSR